MICDGNIQIMAKSILDESTLEVTSDQALYPVANLQNEQLSNRWRSEDAADQQLISDLGEFYRVSGFSLNGHNLGYGSTVQLSLYRTVKTDLTLIDILDIGGGLLEVTFSSAHGLIAARLGAVRLYDHVTEVVVIFHVTQVNSSTVVTCTNTTTSTNFTSDPTSVSMEIAYDGTKDGVPATYGWGLQPWGMGGWYGYATDQKRQTFVTFWFDDVVADYMRVVVKDPQNTDGYIEAGRIMLGDSFSPRYNFSYGSGITYASQTTVTRVRSGAMISDNRPSYRVAKFSLSYMTENEGVEMLDMMDNPSNKSDALVSLYPEHTGQLGQVTTILGRFMSHGDLINNKGDWQLSVVFEEGL